MDGSAAEQFTALLKDNGAATYENEIASIDPHIVVRNTEELSPALRSIAE